MTNLQIIQQAYQAFAEGDIKGVTSVFDPNIEWNECQGFPYIQGEGIFIGPQAIVQNVFAKMPEHFEDFNVQVQELFACQDKVVMKGYYQGKWSATGKPFKANATHIWTMKDGKATHFFQAVDTGTILGKEKTIATI